MKTVTGFNIFLFSTKAVYHTDATRNHANTRISQREIKPRTKNVENQNQQEELKYWEFWFSTFLVLGSISPGYSCIIIISWHICVIHTLKKINNIKASYRIHFEKVKVPRMSWYTCLGCKSLTGSPSLVLMMPIVPTVIIPIQAQKYWTSSQRLASQTFIPAFPWHFHFF